MFQRGVDAPFARPASDVGGGRGRRLGQEFGDVETDAAGADDRDTFADWPQAHQSLMVTHHHRMILPRNVRIARRDAGGDDHGIEVPDLQGRRVGAFPEVHFDAEFIQQVAPVTHRFGVFLLAGNAPGEFELTAYFGCLLVQAHGVSALRERGHAGKARRACADYRKTFLLRDRRIDEFGFVTRARIHQARRAPVFEYVVEARLVAGDARV